MTKEEITLRIDELNSELALLNNKADSLYREIKDLHYQLDSMDSMETAPKILDPLVGKLIIIHEEDNFSVIKLDHWEIDKSIPSIINLFYNRMHYKRNNTVGSFRQRYYEDMFKYFISISKLDTIELFNGSEIQKKYPSMGITFD